MTVQEALDKIDTLRPNAFTKQEKLRWLSTVDGVVKNHVLDSHMGERQSFQGYDAETDADTQLLIPEPYAEGVYLHWLAAQIDLANGEYDRYNAEIVIYNATWDEFAKWWNRTHRPKGVGAVRLW